MSQRSPLWVGLLLAGGLAGVTWPAMLRTAPQLPNLNGPPQRVICLAPSLTETAFALGAGDRVVGRSDYCDEPSEVQDRPALGGYYNPRLEQIIALNPDLILVQSSQTWLSDRLHRLGLATAGFEFGTVEGILNATEEMGELLGLPDEGKALAATMREELHREVSESPARVLWVHYHDAHALTGILGLGPGGHTDEILRRAGGQNVLSDSPVMTPSLSPEMILLLKPDIILVDVRFQQDRDDWESRVHKLWEPLLSRPELAHCRLRFLTTDLPYRPGPRLGQAVRLLEDLFEL